MLKVGLWDKTIRVVQSHHTSVELPSEGQVDDGLTKDYSDSKLHRFKTPETHSKYASNICPPTSTLHLSNIPDIVEEDDIKDAFAIENLTVQGFRFFFVGKDDKMALVQLGSVEEAVKGLIKLHNYQLSDDAFMRVSFSKSTV